MYKFTSPLCYFITETTRKITNMFLRSDQFTSSVIQILFGYLRSLKFQQAESFVSSHVVSLVFPGNLRWFTSLLRDVTGKALSCAWRSLFCVEMESVVELLVLRCYGFTKSWIRLASLSQPDVKGECPAKLPGRPRTSKLKSEDERERFKAALVVLSGLSLDTPRRLSQSDCSCGTDCSCGNF